MYVLSLSHIQLFSQQRTTTVDNFQLGIVVLMWGSTIPCVYYGFYCAPDLQRLYYTLVSVLAACCVYATLHPAFRRPRYRPYRAAMYAGLGLSFIIPIIHGLSKFGWETQVWRMSLDWMALMTAFNLTGGALYALRVSPHSCVAVDSVFRGHLLNGNSLDSREVVSLSLRCMGCKPPVDALSGHMCRYRAFVWPLTGFRSHSWACRHLQLASPLSLLVFGVQTTTLLSTNIQILIPTMCIPVTAFELFIGQSNGRFVKLNNTIYLQRRYLTLPSPWLPSSNLLPHFLLYHLYVKITRKFQPGP